MVELPVILISYGAVIGCYIAFYYWTENHTDLVGSLLGTCVYTVVIVALGALYKIISGILANWENHRFWEQWANSLISKTFLF